MIKRFYFKLLIRHFKNKKFKKFSKLFILLPALLLTSCYAVNDDYSNRNVHINAPGYKYHSTPGNTMIKVRGNHGKDKVYKDYQGFDFK